MVGKLAFLVLAFFALTTVCQSTIFYPVSESHRSAALELFASSDGPFVNLESTYEALRTFEVLGIEKSADIRFSVCTSVLDTLKSETVNLKDLFHALRANGLLKCEINYEVYGGIQSKFEDSLNSASALLDFYYAIGGLVLLKDHSPELKVNIGDADKIVRSIKALSQSDGRWQLTSNKPESSFDASGIALQAIAGVVSLSTSEINHSLIAAVKTDILKLFDGIEKYDDGAYSFEEKLVDASGHQGPLAASASVVRGITAFAAVSPETLN
ncbi:hypothetical protein M569_08766, partial [Genlisea aurea]